MPDRSRSLLLRQARLPGADAPVDLRIDDGVITRVAHFEQSSAANTGRTGQLDASGSRGALPDEVVDLEGRYVIPGLWDEHVHLTQWAMSSRRVDLSNSDSARAVADVIRTERASTSDAGLIVGYGFRDALWADEPTATMLDEAGAGSGVVLVSADLHCVWLNSNAAAQLGVEIDASGLLREDAAFAVERLIGDLPDELLDRWAREAGVRAASRGVVGIADFEMAYNPEVWLRRRASGFDSLRVRAGVYARDLDRALAAGLRTGQQLDDLIEVGYLKVITDGSLNTRTAYCCDPYPAADVDAYGVLTVPADELEALLTRGRDGGLVPAVHAIGDHAITIALDTFERLGIRGRIEHAQLVAETDFGRFAGLGVTASVQPAHLVDDRDAADVHWAGRTGRAFPLRSLLEHGADLALGSDAPVAPLDPWVAIDAAVHRSAEGDPPWHGEQTIPVAAALAASAGGRRGVEVGTAADLAVIDIDPLSDPSRRLRDLPVAATLLNGRFTHRAL